MNPPADTIPPEAHASDTKTTFVRIEDLSTQDKEDWRGLASRRIESAPFVDERWMGSWIAAFAPTDHLCVCVRRDGRIVGLAFMVPRREKWAGSVPRLLDSATNAWSYRYEFLALDDDGAIYRSLWSALFSRRRWEVVRLNWVVDQTPTMQWGLRVSRELGWSSVVNHGSPSPWRRLPDRGEPWDKGLKSKFKSNLRNREKRIESLGEVEFTVVRDPNGLESAVRTFYDIEATSWKGDEGTAIAMQEGARRLFDGLLDGTPGDVWVPILSVGGKPVAAQFLRVWDRTMFLLKTAFDPEYSPYSPGQLIAARVIRYGIENGMGVLDFLGVPMAWKSDWAPEERPNVELVFFAPSVAGRYAYWTRYGFKNAVKKLPFAVPLVRRFRGVEKER